jgi:hypothetical protein
VTSNRQARRRRPLPPGQTFYTPGASAGRQSVEQRSAAPLVYLHQLPAWAVPVAFAVLFFAGLTLRGPLGGVLLALSAVFLGWLGLVSWPRLSARGRLGRIIAVVAVLAFAVIQGLR